MATYESITYTPHKLLTESTTIDMVPNASVKVIYGLPQIFWKDGSAWNEANFWALDKAQDAQTSISTVKSNMVALLKYANWLENNQVNWTDFPADKSQRCLVRYRGYLIDERNSSKISPSTASAYMAHAIQFYKWLTNQSLISPETKMWKNHTVYISIPNQQGIDRIIKTVSTDLAIRNRKSPTSMLEDGLMPVSVKDRDEILAFTKENCGDDLFLMLSIGFYTGMRIGTISDLRIETLLSAIPHPASSELYLISVGPGAKPRVATKGGVTGQIVIPKLLMDQLINHFNSYKRILRSAKASTENKNLIFLTTKGNSYARRGADTSPAINGKMFSLRKKAKKLGFRALLNFHFHQSRCTFATELASLAISASGPINAIYIVKTFLLHKHESTSLKYIKFVENKKILTDVANKFTRDFMGIINCVKNLNV